MSTSLRFWNTSKVFDGLHATQHSSKEKLLDFISSLNVNQIRYLVSSIFIPYLKQKDNSIESKNAKKSNNLLKQFYGFSLYIETKPIRNQLNMTLKTKNILNKLNKKIIKPYYIKKSKYYSKFNKNNNKSINNLPTVLLCKIFKYLTNPERAKMATVNDNFRYKC